MQSRHALPLAACCVLVLSVVSPAGAFDASLAAAPGPTLLRMHSVSARPSSVIPALLAGGGFGGRGGIRLRGGGGGGDGDGEKGGENPIMGLWNSYLTALETRPFVTRMATGFFIGLIGDIICQYITGDIGAADLKRMLVFSCWGGFGFTPIAYNWYNLIEATIPDIGGRAIWKMAMDQILFPPAITSLTFLCLTVVEGMLSGISWTVNGGLKSSGITPPAFSTLVGQGVDKVKKELKPTLITNYKVWPAAQLLNFAVVPVKLQVLFVNCVAVWWNFVLSMTQHK
mmetsp:Transcript_6328/g.14862  ORF Transcript_6328/g.14862 Transcript_6328/m.14862 type:complete len:285 (-) Transcript_6328:40-894(-)